MVLQLRRAIPVIVISILMTNLLPSQGKGSQKANNFTITDCGTVTESGVYTLANALSSDTDCLVIAADFVTIDLARFPIVSTGGVDGITDMGISRTGLTILNGDIRGFVIGVNLAVSQGTTVEGLRLVDNRTGLWLGPMSTVRRSQAIGNGRGAVVECPSSLVEVSAWNNSEIDLEYTNQELCQSDSNHNSAGQTGGGCEGTVCEGVCTDLFTDENNCGACAVACDPGEQCVGGVCEVSCPSGQTECSGICVDLNSDETNCGGCGQACNSGEFCIAGMCQVSCPAGQTVCSGLCVDLNSDESNCGDCGLTCNSGELCIAGMCQVSCPDCPLGQTLCSGLCVDLISDESNCGDCGLACRSGELCIYARCQVSCPTPQTACSGLCVDLSSDEDNCGACSVVCDPGELCLAGECVTPL